MVTPIEVCNGVEGSQPSFSSHSLFLLRAQLPLISQLMSFVRTGTMRNVTSTPLLVIRPAFILRDVLPVSALVSALMIWLRVLVL